jgi:hypothetical protein
MKLSAVCAPSANSTVPLVPTVLEKNLPQFHICLSKGLPCSRFPITEISSLTLTFPNVTLAKTPKFIYPSKRADFPWQIAFELAFTFSFSPLIALLNKHHSRP